MHIQILRLLHQIHKVSIYFIKKYFEICPFCQIFCVALLGIQALNFFLVGTDYTCEKNYQIFLMRYLSVILQQTKFYESRIFCLFTTLGFFSPIRILNYQNRSINVNITSYIKKKNALLHLNSGFGKLDVWWVERGINFYFFILASSTFDSMSVWFYGWNQSSWVTIWSSMVLGLYRSIIA